MYKRILILVLGKLRVKHPEIPLETEFSEGLQYHEKVALGEVLVPREEEDVPVKREETLFETFNRLGGNVAACKDGWILVQCRDMLEIQKYDQSLDFIDDDSAIDYLRESVKDGVDPEKEISVLQATALAIHDEHLKFMGLLEDAKAILTRITRPSLSRKNLGDSVQRRVLGATLEDVLADIEGDSKMDQMVHGRSFVSTGIQFKLDYYGNPLVDIKVGEFVVPLTVFTSKPSRDLPQDEIDATIANEFESNIKFLKPLMLRIENIKSVSETPRLPPGLSWAVYADSDAHHDSGFGAHFSEAYIIEGIPCPCRWKKGYTVDVIVARGGDYDGTPAWRIQLTLNWSDGEDERNETLDTHVLMHRDHAMCLAENLILAIPRKSVS